MVKSGGTNELASVTVLEDSRIELVYEAMANHAIAGKGGGFAIVIGAGKKVTGVITDADIRRYISRHASVPKKARDVMQRDFTFVEKQNSDSEIARRLANSMENSGWFTRLPFRFVPKLDEKGCLIDVLDASEYEDAISIFRDEVVVVGLGYVGLTTFAAMRLSEISAVGLDSDSGLIDQLSNGLSPLSEPGLGAVIEKNTKSFRRYQKSLDFPPKEQGKRRYFVICLPTPATNDKRALETNVIEDFVEGFIENVKVGDVIVMRSTVPTGFGRKLITIVENLKKWKVGSDFFYVSAPERTVEGNALQEIRNLPQLVGGATELCTAIGMKLFKRVTNVALECSSIEVAETSKLAGNAYRDYTFAFANQLAEFCRGHKIEVQEVIEKSNYGYLRSAIPKPSPGVGGSCLTKDPHLFGSDTTIAENSPIKVARQYNETVPRQVVDFLESEFKHFAGSKMVLVGAAFKGFPETADTRNSTSLEIAKLLIDSGKNLVITDAVVSGQLPTLNVSCTKFTEIRDAQVVLLMNNHEQNREICQTLIRKSKEKKIAVFDPWNLLSKDDLVGLSEEIQIEILTMSKREKVSF